jgi:hypothetical protein
LGGGAQPLAELLGNELFRPAPEAARELAVEIRRRCGGDAVAAVLFYGSCLRGRTAEGVLDFYVLVDGYRKASPSRALAWAGALFPPNVFYLELVAPRGTLRAKYAVLSTRDFERGTGSRGLRPSIWARFSQPAIAVYTRDAEAKQNVVGAAQRAVLTTLERMVPLMPAHGDLHRFRPEELWHRAFQETYSAEMRPETPETIRAVYLAEPDRFDRVARLGLGELERRGRIRLSGEDDAVEVILDRWWRRRSRLAWRLRRPLAKLVYLTGLIKSALTFGDWLPYALWKLERHTGTRIAPSERQRRHPLIWGWPLLLRALWQRDLR